MSNTQSKLSKNAHSLLDILAQPGHYLYVKVVEKFTGVREEFYLLKLTGDIPDESGRSEKNGQIHLTKAQFAEAERTFVHSHIATAVSYHPEMSGRGFVLEPDDEEPFDFFSFRSQIPEIITQSRPADDALFPPHR